MELKSVKAYRTRRLVLAAGAGMARVYKHIAEGQFAIVSASKSNLSPEENQRRTDELRKSFASEEAGGYIPAAGVWEGVAEDSIILPGASKELALQIAREYNQDAVIWGDQGKFYFLGQDGSVQGGGQVSDWFHYLGKGEEAEEAPGYTELPKGQRFQLREPKPGEPTPEELWELEGVPVKPEVVHASIKVKGKFSFSLGHKFDLKAEGVPFFFICDADGAGIPKMGFAVHSPDDANLDHLSLRVQGGSERVVPKKWLAAYLPCRRK